MLAAVAPTPLPSSEGAVEAYARSLIRAAASETFPPEHFYIFDLGAVYERWRVWTTSLPRVTPYYAGARHTPAIFHRAPRAYRAVPRPATPPRRSHGT